MKPYSCLTPWCSYVELVCILTHGIYFVIVKDLSLGLNLYDNLYGILIILSLTLALAGKISNGLIYRVRRRAF